MNFAKRLENLRKARCENWTELQSALGVSKTLLHYWKKGQRVPSPKQMRRLIELEAAAGIQTKGAILDVLSDVERRRVPYERQHLVIKEALSKKGLLAAGTALASDEQSRWLGEIAQIRGALRDVLSRLDGLESEIRAKPTE